MKKLLTPLFIFCAAMASSQNLANGLTACYPFDNNAQNYAGTGAVLNGTLTNVQPAAGHTGLPSTARVLNGTIGSYIELPDNPGLKSDSVFFSGWFRPDSLPYLQYLVYTTNGCASNFEAYSLELNTAYGSPVFSVSKCGSNCGYKPQIVSSTPITTGNWYHVCFYVTNTVMKLYVNGVFQSSVNHNVLFGYQPGYSVYIGVTNQSNFNYPFKGAVDNVRFYNRGLTQQEITMLYTQDPLCDDKTVSIAETALQNSTSIYPNPASDRLYVEGLGDNSITVCDLLGRTLKYTKSQVSETVSELNLQDAVPGVYFIKVAKGSYLYSSKLVLVK